MPEFKVKLSKMHKSVVFVIPTNIVQELALKDKQRMATWSNDGVIMSKPLGDDEPTPAYECMIRKLHVTGHIMRLILPTPILDKFQLTDADFILIKTKEVKGVKYMLSKPAVQTIRSNLTTPSSQATNTEQETNNTAQSQDPKLSKMHKSMVFVIPANIIQEFKLKDKQKMAIWSNDDIMISQPLEDDEPKPPYQCWIRNLNYDKNFMRLIIPTPIIEKFKLADENSVRIKAKKADGVNYLMLKPARPQSRVKVQQEEDGTLINIYKLKPDGKTIDEKQEPIMEKMPHEEANDMLDALDAGDASHLENYIYKFKSIRLRLPKDYQPEKFVKRKEIQKEKEDRTTDV